MAPSNAIARGTWLVLAGLALLAGAVLLGLQVGAQPAAAAGCWQAAITEQWEDPSLPGSLLRVSVQGKGGLKVTVRGREGNFETWGLTGSKPEFGPNVVEFAALSRSWYIIEPEGLGLAFEVWLDGENYTRVAFTPKSCGPTATPTGTRATSTPTRRPTATPTRSPAATSQPAPATPSTGAQWRARIAEKLNNPSMYLATIDVRVVGRPAGQVVHIQHGGYSASCTTGTKPEHGPGACEIGGLGADSYTLSPDGLDVSYTVTVGHGDFVLVEFYPVGGPVIDHWVGSVKKNTSAGTPGEASNSAIAVVVTGRPWLNVEIRANTFTATCMTGYKQEYGPDACEFGGLHAGTYTLTPEGLNVTAQVTVDGTGWAMVQFDPVYAPAPAGAATATPALPPAGKPATPQPSATPTPAGPLWKGSVESNTSGTQPKGISSVIVVRVQNHPGVPVTITGGGGWSAICTTGTKPEYGPAACEFGGLWAATYILRPEGSDVEVSIFMDGQGFAIVNFKAP